MNKIISAKQARELVKKPYIIILEGIFKTIKSKALDGESFFEQTIPQQDYKTKIITELERLGYLVKEQTNNIILISW